MTILIDTHALLGFFQDHPQFSTTAKASIEDAANRKLVSVASCWEIAIKAGLGKLKLGEPAAALLAREIPKNNCEMLSISLSHATAVESLPMRHKDPFDRLLIAQSQLESAPLVSHDTQFDSYGIQRLW